VTAPVWSTVMATGHRVRDVPRDAHDWVRDQLDRVAGKLRTERGMKRGYTGMALFTDMLWADALHRSQVSFTAHIPFPQQPDPWRRHNPQAVAEWERLRELAADEVVYGDLTGLAEHARKRVAVRLLHERNDGMLTGRLRGRQVCAPADAVVAVWCPSKLTGGTYSAVTKAHAVGLPVIHINPDAGTVTMPTPARLARLLHPGTPEPLPFDAALGQRSDCHPPQTLTQTRA
jgi:hypothetical protein